MKVLLGYDEESEGGQAAQTGNLVHAAAAVLHTTTDLEAGLAALEVARQEFPKGDPEKARAIFRSYAADPANQNHKAVLWCEKAVRLVLAPAPDDPTGEPIVIEGTLDQVRLDFRLGDEVFHGRTVWDIKTGGKYGPEENLDDYLIQQAVYVLAARQTLHPDITPGGLIYTPGYEKPRARRFLPYRLTVEQCMMFVAPVVHAVTAIRKGQAAFRPSADNCRYCEFRPFTKCSRHFTGLYGANEYHGEQQQHDEGDPGPDEPGQDGVGPDHDGGRPEPAGGGEGPPRDGDGC